jgi:hypothetical protein
VTARVSWYRGTVSSVVLAAFLLWLAGTSRVEWAAIPVVLVGVGLGAVLRRVADPQLKGLAPVPPLVGLGALSLLVPPTATVALLAGIGAVLFLVWLADDPARVAGGVGRAIPTLVIATLAVAVAWGSSSLVPSGSASLGVAAALLLAVVALVSLFVAAPELIGLEEGTSS